MTHRGRGGGLTLPVAMQAGFIMCEDGKGTEGRSAPHSRSLVTHDRSFIIIICIYVYLKNRKQLIFSTVEEKSQWENVMVDILLEKRLASKCEFNAQTAKWP